VSGADVPAERTAAMRKLRTLGRRAERARATLERAVAERDEAILAAARTGAARQAIADAAAVTVGRVQQVLSEHGAARPYRRGQPE